MVVNSRFVVPNGTRYSPSESEEYFKLERRVVKERGYQGLFSCETIPKGAVVGHTGGVVVSSVEDLPNDPPYATIIAPNLFLAPSSYANLPNLCFLNHSCESNLARIGGIVLVAKCDIALGAELTIDYAPFVSGVEGWEMNCLCGSKLCRGRITGEDWKSPEIAARLWTEWLPFIQRKILAKGLIK
jgi:SET domain-containing protein